MGHDRHEIGFPYRATQRVKAAIKSQANSASHVPTFMMEADQSCLGV